MEYNFNLIVGGIKLPARLTSSSHPAGLRRVPQRQELLEPRERPAGIAYGGVARRLMMPLLQEAQQRGCPLRAWPEGWDQALALAVPLVTPWVERTC